MSLASRFEPLNAPPDVRGQDFSAIDSIVSSAPSLHIVQAYNADSGDLALTNGGYAGVADTEAQHEGWTKLENLEQAVAELKAESANGKIQPGVNVSEARVQALEGALFDFKQSVQAEKNWVTQTLGKQQADNNALAARVAAMEEKAVRGGALVPGDNSPFVLTEPHQTKGDSPIEDIDAAAVAVAIASTTSTEAVAKRATSMHLASQTGLEAGHMVDIAPGTSAHEVNTIKSFGLASSAIFETPLEFAHPAGTKVVAKDVAAKEAVAKHVAAKHAAATDAAAKDTAAKDTAAKDVAAKDAAVKDAAAKEAPAKKPESFWQKCLHCRCCSRTATAPAASPAPAPAPAASAAKGPGAAAV